MSDIGEQAEKDLARDTQLKRDAGKEADKEGRDIGQEFKEDR